MDDAALEKALLLAVSHGDVESDAFKTDAESGAERMGWMRDGADVSS